MLRFGCTCPPMPGCIAGLMPRLGPPGFSIFMAIPWRVWLKNWGERRTDPTHVRIASPRMELCPRIDPAGPQ